MEKGLLIHACDRLGVEESACMRIAAIESSINVLSRVSIRRGPRPDGDYRR
jgi:hypothetical protein